MRFGKTKPLSTWSRTAVTAAGVVVVAFLGLIDHVTGPEISISVFYLGPVLLVGWYAGLRPGILVGILSALTWLLTDITAGATYSVPAIRYWNAAALFGFFLVVGIMINRLRSAFQREQELSRQDFLTRVANARAFNEIAEAEVRRAQRYEHPITVAYLDVDDFKLVNDRYGHPTGDALLVWVGKTLRETLRQTDLVGRVGGDEFAILLPETAEESAHIVLHKLHRVLRERMELHSWPVTFSIGAVTFLSAPRSMDDMISEADRLMYSAKRLGKDRLEQVVVA